MCEDHFRDAKGGRFTFEKVVFAWRGNKSCCFATIHQFRKRKCQIWSEHFWRNETALGAVRFARSWTACSLPALRIWITLVPLPLTAKPGKRDPDFSNRENEVDSVFAYCSRQDAVGAERICVRILWQRISHLMERLLLKRRLAVSAQIARCNSLLANPPPPPRL